MVMLEQTGIGTRTVGDIMQHAVVTVPPDMPLSEVARLLWDLRLSGAPVVGPDRHPLGVISASDIVRVKGYGPRYPTPARSAERDPAAADLALLALCRDPVPAHVRIAERTARDAMTSALFCVRITTTVPELAKFLSRAGVHRALVLDEGKLVGIVTAFDIVDELARHGEPGAAEELPDEGADIEC